VTEHLSRCHLIACQACSDADPDRTDDRCGSVTLAAATDLFDLLDARRPGGRRSTASRATVDALKASHAFRMPMPAAWGGPELPVTDQLLVFEELTYADGAAGWCAMIGCDAGYYSAMLEDAVAREIWDDLDLITAGQTSPSGKAVRDGDGWKVSGRWAFRQWVHHADRIVGGAFLHTADGEPITDNGLPAWRTFVLPMDAVTIHDNWDPTGLAGTGSHDYSTDGAWVPDVHAMQPLEPGAVMAPSTRSRGGFIVKAAAVPLGLARRALDELTTMAPGKLVFPEFQMLDDLGHTTTTSPAPRPRRLGPHAAARRRRRCLG